MPTIDELQARKEAIEKKIHGLQTYDAGFSHINRDLKALDTWEKSQREKGQQLGEDEKRQRADLQKEWSTLETKLRNEYQIGRLKMSETIGNCRELHADLERQMGIREQQQTSQQTTQASQQSQQGQPLTDQQLIKTLQDHQKTLLEGRQVLEAAQANQCRLTDNARQSLEQQVVDTKVELQRLIEFNQSQIERIGKIPSTYRPLTQEQLQERGHEMNVEAYKNLFKLPTERSKVQERQRGYDHER